ncbi:hypothetical protein NBRC3299_0244 [Acetobacter pasteurianus NBRC 3299]|nr:hypothetical protein AZ09_10510 [Acetobacter aceti 1023]RCL09554.1 hypothetical protein BBA71_02025 [Acetobacter pasteurianus]GCD73952.1 hypothetical protein NBRC3299_0244 [Acetobacter pasteurianus NBRC 3299]
MRQFHRMDIQEFIRRYDSALKAAGLSNRRATELAGVKEDTTRNPRRKGTSPDILAVVKLAHVLNVAPSYFLEPLGITAETLGLSVQPPDNAPHNDEEIALLQIWRRMDEDQRRSWLLLLEHKLSSDVA